jgi:hypothetical protein
MADQDQEQEKSPTTRVERRPPDDGEPDENAGFANLPRAEGTRVRSGDKMPGGQQATTGILTPATLRQLAGADGEREFVQFTLSEKLMGLAWKAGKTGGFPPDKGAIFAMVELTPEEEDKAVSAAGAGIKLQAAFSEMVKASIWMVGGELINYDTKGKWLRAIGPRARKQVERAYNDLNGIEEAEGEAILATAQSSVRS